LFLIIIIKTSKCGPNTVLTFVTVGYLLERLVHYFSDLKASSNLKNKGQSWEYTHIVVDEVHERDLETDLLCLVLRLLLQRHDEAVREGNAG
jgi:HrpA-like RNA helicase